MTLDEFYNLSKDECLVKIKAECQSQAKQRLYFGAILALIIIALMIFTWTRLDHVRNLRILPFFQFSVICLAAVWEAVSNYRFLQWLDNLNAPEHLLHWYEKTMNNNRNAYYLGMLGLICNVVDPYAFANHEWDWVWVDMTFVILMLAFMIYSYFKGDYLRYKTDRDEEIIDRLHDLINMK